ncbi:o-succinylbenzoate--CoA ligase [Oryzihumus leptocrescens]|uniref:O-succinylbenzoic acid--CoA ligase n=1 Tax=Oryzihumus leptocrescens TaxID=297536 RepID=A0A542ZN66_9MICO|nr:o-succinylbenzoate--CoA ligase [Oryzihumus leptocrescens]TQL61719.1 O-succinylbenzoic acid--CoA ligase [Oryzihumus leptocrescens]
MTRDLATLAVPPGADALRVLPDLARALDGTGPALLPFAAGSKAPALPPAPGTPADLALAVGTSGSTGRPKRALLTTSALQASARATHARLGGDGQWLLAMPAHHVAGLQVLVRSLVAGTAPVAVDTSDGFTPAAFVAATGRLDPAARSYTALVPTQLVRLLQDPEGREALARYAAVLLGGAAAPPSLLARAADAGVTVATTYGMSETAGGCVYDGLPLDGTRFDLDDDGRISLGGPTVAHGYLAEPGLGAAAFTRGPDGTRWFRTDDLGHVDADGALHVQGRVDDLVNTGGVKVAPRVVEEALLAHVEGVTEAVVVGVPDEEWGQAVAAAVVVADPADPPALADVRARLHGILPGHALPRRLLVLPAIPLRGPGKPDRAALRTQFGDTPTQ